MALDTEALRQRAQRNCERAAKAFAAADQDLRNFEREDLPAFERWKAIALGPLIAEFKQRSAELDEKQFFYAVAMDESESTGLPPWEALEEWKKEEERESKAYEQRRARGEPEPAMDDDEFGDEDFEDAEFDKFFDEMFKEPGKKAGPKQRAPETHSAERAKGNSSLREVYRKLCRLLHPDAAGEMTPERRDVWHQVQEAYAIGDIGRLENLLARVADTDADVSPRLPRTIGEIVDLQKHYQRAKQQLGHLLRTAKHHPAWRFSLMDERRRNRLREQLEFDLRFGLREISQEMAHIDLVLTPQSKRRKQPRRRNSRDMDFFY